MRTKVQAHVVGGDVWGQEAYGSDQMAGGNKEISRAVAVAQDALGLSDLGLASKAGVSVKALQCIKAGTFKRTPSPGIQRAIGKLADYFERRTT